MHDFSDAENFMSLFVPHSVYNNLINVAEKTFV